METALEAAHSIVPISRDDLFVVALNPQQMEAAQHDLFGWCVRKMRILRLEYRELKDNLAIAKRNRWRSYTIARAVTLCKARIVYYGKIAKALRAGYLIVPNFPLNIFAIRTHYSGTETTGVESDYKDSDSLTQPAEKLPAGEGQYFSPKPTVQSRQVTETNSKNESVKKTKWSPWAFAPVDFPVKAVKPQILDATARAMALKVFDEMGIIEHQRKRDPIVVGKIIDPRSTTYVRREVSFFVAWWLNTESL